MPQRRYSRKVRSTWAGRRVVPWAALVANAAMLLTLDWQSLVRATPSINRFTPPPVEAIRELGASLARRGRPGPEGGQAAS